MTEQTVTPSSHCSIASSDNDVSSIATSESDISKERLLKSRCKSEKKRRDKLNLFIKELQFMLNPGTQKRLDKLTVLKMTVDYLTTRNGSDFSINVNGVQGKLTKSFFIPCDEFGQLMFETTNGFIIAINEDAKLIYVADIVEKILGIKASSIVGKPINSVIHKDDRFKVTEEIMSGVINFDSNFSSNGSFYMDMLDNSSENANVTLNFRVLMNQVFGVTEYRELHCTGKWQYFKESATPGEYGGKVLILLACLNTDFREISPSKDVLSSFSSRHGLDCSFIFADQNCPVITGYTPYEVMGKSLYTFVHADDLHALSSVHKKLTKNCVRDALVFFRFLSKGEEWLLMEVKMHLSSSEQTMQPDCINATFTLAQSEEIQQFRTKAELKKMEMLKIVHNAQQPNKEHVTRADESPDVSQQKNNDRMTDLQEEEHYKEMDSKELEKILEVENVLHDQLAKRHESLSKSFEGQQKKLCNISTIMSEYAPLMQVTAFKEHYQEQLEMYNYFKHVLAKLQRQQGYLNKQIQGKKKDNEIRKRAVKLRNMVSRQQKVLKEIKDRRVHDEPGEEQSFSSSKCTPAVYTNTTKPYMQHKFSSATTTTNSSRVQNVTSTQLPIMHEQSQKDNQRRQQKQPAQQQYQQPTQQDSLQNNLDLLQSEILQQQLGNSSNSSADLQKTISKQILVHLQVLQKHVLTQLVNVMQDKRESISDFGQVLPVLQQLQQLQQSILCQQSDSKTKMTDQQDTRTPSQEASHQQQKMLLSGLLNFTDLEKQTTASSQHTFTPVLGNKTAIDDQNQEFMVQSNVSTECKDMVCEPEANSEKYSVFGNRDACMEELNQIKRAFSYPFMRGDMDKMPESNDGQFSNSFIPDDKGDEGDEKTSAKKGDECNNDELKKQKLEEETTQYQPFLENQQQLVQFQQYQRLQIYLSQRQQMQQAVSAPTTPTTQQPPTSPTTMQQQTTPTTAAQELPTNTEFPDGIQLGFNGDNENMAEFDHALLMPNENEEVLNMLLSEGDFFW